MRLRHALSSLLAAGRRQPAGRRRRARRCRHRCTERAARRRSRYGADPVIVDPAIEALPVEQRALLATLWQERASSESSVRGVFQQLVGELVATGAHPEVIALAERAEGDEARHAAICAELAAAYHGSELTIALSPPVRLAANPSDPPRLRTALHIVNVCCISETIASAFVDACLAECASDALRDVHGRHLADEVRHARIGWAHLASLTSEERGAIASRLPELLRVQVTAWESR